MHYHPGNANVVSDALSRKSHASVFTLVVCAWKMFSTLKDFDLFV